MVGGGESDLCGFRRFRLILVVDVSVVLLVLALSLAFVRMSCP